MPISGSGDTKSYHVQGLGLYFIDQQLRNSFDAYYLVVPHPFSGKASVRNYYYLIIQVPYL